MYRTLQVLHNRYTESFGKIFLPSLKFVQMSTGVIAGYGAIISYQANETVIFFIVLFGMSIVASVVISYISAITGNIYVLSNSFHKFGSLGVVNKNVVIYKSCAQIKVKVAHFYAFQKATVITVFNIIVYGIVKLCIIF